MFFFITLLQLDCQDRVICRCFMFPKKKSYRKSCSTKFSLPILAKKCCYVSQTYDLNVHYVLASYATTKKVTFVTNVSVLKFDLLLHLSSVVKNVLFSSLVNEITKQETNRDKIERIDRTKLYYICNISK